MVMYHLNSLMFVDVKICSLMPPTSEWRGFESRWFCRSGFEFAKIQLYLTTILNHYTLTTGVAVVLAVR